MEDRIVIHLEIQRGHPVIRDTRTSPAAEVSAPQAREPVPGAAGAPAACRRGWSLRRDPGDVGEDREPPDVTTPLASKEREKSGTLRLRPSAKTSASR